MEQFFDIRINVVGTGEGEKLGKLRREELTDGTNLVQRKTYAYDALKRPMLELQNVDGKWYYTAFTYDSFSRVKETHRFWRPQSVIASGDNLSPDWNSFASINTYNERGVVTKVEDGTGHVWWSCEEGDFDARGNLLEYTQGNGVVTTRSFYPLTGRLNSIDLAGLASGLHTQTYEYDRLGNLTQRSLSRTLQSTLTETCGYDSLNRLTSTSVGSANSSVAYNAIGNITAKDGVTDYAYGQFGAGPHAVTTANGISHLYDSCGNLVNRTEGGSNTTAIAWTSFNKPSRIDMDASNAASTNWSEFAYDANHNRTVQTIRNGSSLTKKLYLAGFEQTESSTNLVTPAWTHVETRVFVATPVGTIGIQVQDAQENITRRYLHRDHLGSVIAVTGAPSGGTAPVLAEYSFDAWGTHRNPSDWTALAPSTQPQTALSSDRGFTGHEMLDPLGLVHMNGRIFDSRLGRFLSPDPLIQAPEDLQSFNRYSYVMNRPLTLSDPSGFIADKGIKSVASGVASLAENIGAAVLSALDNIGGEIAETVQQVNDYFKKNDATQVEQSTKATEQQTGETSDEKVGSSTNGNDQKSYGIGSGGDAPQKTSRNSAWSWMKTRAGKVVDGAKKAAKKVVGIANDIVDSDAYAYVSAWAGVIGGAQTAFGGGVTVAAGTVVPGVEIPGAAMVAKGLGDASLNMANIHTMDMGGSADDLLPSSTTSAATSAIGAGMDAVTGGDGNYQGKGEVIGDVVDGAFSYFVSSGTFVSKVMSVSKLAIETADSAMEEW